MEREEFIAKAELIANAADELAAQIEDLAEQAKKYKHEWPSDVSRCVEELQECASEVGGVNRIPFIFKTDDEVMTA